MKSKGTNENYLERIPQRSEWLDFSSDENGIVTLSKENTGLFNRIAQKLFKRPRVSYIHLDEMGSFIWPLLDGNKSIYELGVLVNEHFGDNAEPLYERLSRYLEIMNSYGFICFKD
ncbi:MAG: PqqD family protein [Clostridia bacterium]|nr:PqqD family protein [Clostridia bacterium]